FGSLEQARLANSPGVDIILVRPNPGTPGRDLAVTAPFMLFDNQRLLSTAVVSNFNASLGGFILPGFTGVPKPLISNSSSIPSSVIQLANNNEVSGFTIDGRNDVSFLGAGVILHTGITSKGQIVNFNINRNCFQNVANGVVIAASGTGLFENNMILGSLATGRGFSVTTSGGSTLDLLIAGNSATGILGGNEDANGSGGFDPGEDINGNGILDFGTAYEATADASTINAIVVNNTTSGNSIGLGLNTRNGGTINATLQGNAFSNDNISNVQLAGVDGTINFTASGNIFSQPTNFGAGILINTTRTNVNALITDNMFLGGPNASFGIGGRLRGGNLNLFVADNLFRNNGNAGIGITLANSDPGPDFNTGTPLMGDGADGNITIVNNTIQGTHPALDPLFFGDAIHLRLEGQEHSALIDQNDINGDGVPDGPLVPPPDGSDDTNLIQPAPTLVAVIDRNLLGDLFDPALGNIGSGVAVTVQGDSAIRSLLIGNVDPFPGNGNIIANNQEDGIRVRRTDAAIIDNFLISDNLIQNNLSDGIDIAAENNGLPFGVEEILNFDIVDNQILRNGMLSDGTLG
ncbi:MAG: hypothetical protein ACREIV_06320, partial [Planctomycetaceae bacterium]